MGWRTMAEWEWIQGNGYRKRDVLQGFKKKTPGAAFRLQQTATWTPLEYQPGEP
jgi:hypothetical protein